MIGRFFRWVLTSGKKRAVHEIAEYVAGDELLDAAVEALHGKIKIPGVPKNQKRAVVRAVLKPAFEWLAQVIRNV